MRKHSLKAGLRPKSRFRGGGDDRTIDPGGSGDVTFQIYRIYYRQLKQQDVLGSLTKTYVFYFVWGLDCDRVSELHCSLPVGSVGVRLLSMMIPDSCASDSDLDSLVLTFVCTLFRCPLYECMMIVEGCTNPMRKINVAPTYLYTK